MTISSVGVVGDRIVETEELSTRPIPILVSAVFVLPDWVP